MDKELVDPRVVAAAIQYALDHPDDDDDFLPPQKVQG